MKKPKVYAMRVPCPMCDYSLKLRLELVQGREPSYPYLGGMWTLDIDESDLKALEGKRNARKRSPSTKRSTKPLPKRKKRQ